MNKLLTTLTVAVALTSAADAKDFAWFHGDIGVDSSPVVWPASPADKVTIQATAKRDVVARRKSASNGSVAVTKSKAAHERITAR
jgi:hypothetical protein